MAAYATPEQYVARFGEVDDRTLLAECLDDASAAIDAVLDRHGVGHANPTPDYARRLMIVCRSVANRLMPAGTDVPAGVTQMSVTAGNHNENVSFTPVYGTAKLLPSELSMLGLGGSRGRMLHPAMADLGGDVNVAG